MAKKPIPLPIVPAELPKEEEPPKCPPPGAPAWMATFADIAILLMAFFVLILSFAEFNQPKFKMIAGSLRESFGVQREMPVVEQPRGTTVLELKFSPSAEPSITNELTQDTTTEEQPKIRTDVDDQQKRSDHDKEQSGETGQKSDAELRAELAELLQEALETGVLSPDAGQNELNIDYQPDADVAQNNDAAGAGEQTADNSQFDQQGGAQNDQAEQAAAEQAAQEAAEQDALGQPQLAQEQSEGATQIDPLTGEPREATESGMPQDDLRNGMPQMADNQTAEQSEGEMMAQLIDQLNTLTELAEAQTEASQSALDAITEGEAAAEGAANHPEGIDGESKAAIASDNLAVALRRELGEGLVEVEQRDGKVYVTVGAGGAFPSGTADLTQDARDIMDRIAFSAMNDASSITVTGHTDDVPVSAGSQFRDNWGLAAARSASVVRAFAGSGLIDPSQLTATSMGESQPVADNSTPEGREENRRIEIEISY